MRNVCFGNVRYGIVMRFFDRQFEIRKLQRIEELSKEVSQFTVVSGRRRIGKTALIRKAYEDLPLVYLFVARKTESDLCESFVDSIREVLNVPVLGKVSRFIDIFRFLMEIAKTQHITVMIDEFQEFYKINPSVFSEMQDVWDRNKADAKINLVVCGSMNSLLNKIFRDKKEPLYGRQTDMIKVRAFAPSVLKEIMAEYNSQYSKEDLLALYLLTGGVAKYVELFADRRILTKDDMIDAFFEKDSYFLTEGKSMLIEEFGKEYGTYFSILSLIAQGHNTRSDIENILGIEIGGYIKKLVDDYELITKRQPLFENVVNKNVRYALEDNFLKFWFRFVFRYEYMLETGANAKLKNLVNADYEAYSGRILEAYFRESLIEQGLFTRIGYWHSRNGQNEIDIIGQDESAKKAVFYEVKRQKDNIDIAVLKEKAQAFLTATHEFKKYDIGYVGLSMEDM